MAKKTSRQHEVRMQALRTAAAIGNAVSGCVALALKVVSLLTGGG